MPLATGPAVAEVVALVELAEQSLFPQLRSIHAPWVVGLIFTASQWMSADADLIVGRTPIEANTNIGGLKAGVRSPELSVGGLRQLVGYVRTTSMTPTVLTM